MLFKLDIKESQYEIHTNKVEHRFKAPAHQITLKHVVWCIKNQEKTTHFLLNNLVLTRDSM